MNKTILQRIAKENYITHHWTQTSGYLTPDGRWVHLISKEDEDRGGWYREDHRSIQHFLNSTYEERCGYGNGTHAMWRAMARHKFVRFSPEGNGFEFIGRLTAAQARAIRDYYRDVRRENDTLCIEKLTLKPYPKTNIIASNFEEFREYCYENNISI